MQTKTYTCAFFHPPQAPTPKASQSDTPACWKQDAVHAAIRSNATPSLLDACALASEMRAVSLVQVLAARTLQEGGGGGRGEERGGQEERRGVWRYVSC